MRVKPEAIICDIDGTICDVSELRPWVTGKRTDFDIFHALADLAEPIQWVIDELANHWDKGRSIILVTARDYLYYEGTVRWLDRHRVVFDELYMRPARDPRPDREVKEEILMNLADRYDILLAYDDNPHVIPLWEEYGIPVTVVPGWID